MPEFHLDTAGKAYKSVSETTMESVTWRDLDAFTQGYIEALFFTESAPGVTTEEWQATEDHDEGSIPGDVGFSDLAPDALASIIEDCAAFQRDNATALSDAFEADSDCDDSQAGHDFWLTRCGHGAGFWDGDWPEPMADQLDAAAKAFGNVDSYLGDDGKVYLS